MTENDLKTRYREFIKRIVFFRVMNETEIENLLRASSLRIYQEGDVIVQQGDVNQTMYAIIQGSVQVSVDQEQEKDVYISTIGDGEVFGEAGLFLKVRRTASVSALTKTILIELHRREMIRFIKEYPTAGNKVLMVIIHSMLRKLQEANQELAYERKLDADQCDVDAIISSLSGK
jgi:CRP/FNR family transcriptional regulator, cyclic AMP receptor protein